MLLFTTTVLLIVNVGCIDFRIKNNLRDTIWVGILGYAGHPHLTNGGFELKSNEERILQSDEKWSGEFWARTGCNPITKICKTGHCDNKLECQSNDAVGPATYAKIHLRENEGKDKYSVSLIDGFNVITKIEPIASKGNCRSTGCSFDLNKYCPSSLRLEGSAGQTVGCYSSRSKLDIDQFMCEEQERRPHTCDSGTWIANSASYFKSHCPNVVSYNYDEINNTFTCIASVYQITFG